MANRFKWPNEELALVDYLLWDIAGKDPATLVKLHTLREKNNCCGTDAPPNIEAQGRD